MYEHPTLMLVNGAWHRATMWDALRDELADVPTVAVQLPSSADVPVARLGDLFADATTIQRAVTAIDGPVVVCAHSYGGAPTSQALGGFPQVRRIVYLNAFMLDIGESMISVAGGTYKPHWDVHELEGYVAVKNPDRVLYNDLLPAAAAAASAKLGPQSLASLKQRLTKAAWHDTDSTYVTGKADAGVPAALSATFAARARRSLTIEASHSAFLSQPAELAQLLRGELRDAMPQ